MCFKELNSWGYAISTSARPSRGATRVRVGSFMPYYFIMKARIVIVFQPLRPVQACCQQPYSRSIGKVSSQHTLQSLTGKYRGLQGNPCNENRDPAMRTGVPCNENRFFPVGIDSQGVPCELYRVWVCSVHPFCIRVSIPRMVKQNQIVFLLLVSYKQTKFTVDAVICTSCGVTQPQNTTEMG